MKRLYLATCPETNFSIVVYADNTKNARRLMLDNLEAEFDTFVMIEADVADWRPFAADAERGRFIEANKPIIDRFFAQDKFKITRIDRITQLPPEWRGACPWGTVGLDGDCATLLNNYKKELKKAKEEKQRKKLQFIKEQAARLDKILQKKGVDALFLYSLIDHGLSEEVVNYWKDTYFPPLLKGLKYIYADDDGNVCGNVFYIDKTNDKYDAVWVVTDMFMDEKIKTLALKMLEKIVFSLFDKSGDKLEALIDEYKEYKVEIVEKRLPKPEEIRKYTLAGLETTYCRKYLI